MQRRHRKHDVSISKIFFLFYTSQIIESKIIINCHMGILRIFIIKYLCNFCSNKYERKQLALCKAWESEQSEIQVVLENIIDDLNSLQSINAKEKESIYEQK